MGDLKNRQPNLTIRQKSRKRYKEREEKKEEGRNVWATRQTDTKAVRQEGIQTY